MSPTAQSYIRQITRAQQDDLAGRTLVHERTKEDVPQIVEQYMTLEAADQAKEASSAAK
jgi:hypothetical protein